MKQYEAPKLVVLGTFADLTLNGKAWGQPAGVKMCEHWILSSV
jgi:hypothetical protein